MQLLRFFLALLAAVVMTVTIAQAAKTKQELSEENITQMEEEMMEEAEQRELERIAEADVSKRRASLGWGLWGGGYPYYGAGYGYPYGGWGYPSFGYGYGLGRYIRRVSRE